MRLLSTLLPLVATAVACGGAGQRTVHTATYPNGEPRWRTDMRAGVPDGPSATYHPHGQLASRGRYRAGRKQGRFDYYDERGRLIRVESFRDGQLVGVSRDPDPAAEHAPPSSVQAFTAPAAAPSDHYTELRLGIGMGASTAARERDSRAGAEPTGSMNVAVLRRSGPRLIGATAQFSGGLFGPSHSYLGGTVGYAGSGQAVHLELLAEGGVHTISGMGDDLFAEGMGDNSAMLPYLGAHARLVFDPGAAKGVVVELALAQRVDVVRTSKVITQESCFFGCTSQRQTWDVGGSSTELVAGFSYQF